MPGISMSRKRTSGLASRILGTASTGSWLRPTISTRLVAASMRCSRFKASASSSTRNARMAIDSENEMIPACHSLQHQLRAIPEYCRQPAFQVVETMAGGRRFQLERRARIGNFDAEGAVRTSSSDANFTTHSVGCDGVFYAVFNQGLQRKRRNLGLVQVSRNVDLIPQPVAQTRALDLQIIADNLQLAGQRHQSGLMGIQREAQQRGHLFHQA